MSTHLGDLLHTARRQHFVGRRHELASFDDALGGRSPARVIFVHGQGGIGKTTLLQEFQVRARAAGRPVVQVDGRDVDPSPDGVSAAVGDDPPLGVVVLIDGYERLTPIDGWVRTSLIPGLRADSVVVLAGREPPSAPWRTDPGWRHLMSPHLLEPLGPADGERLLARAGVAAVARQQLVRLSRGHPLTMALLAELATSGKVPGTLAEAPDLISALVGSFLDDVPSEAHLTGLATCAIAWLTTEQLLARQVGEHAATVWNWLARRPFVTTSPRGLFTHDLVRDVLDAEFERRSPGAYLAHHRAIRDHAVAGLRAASGVDRQMYAQQLLFLLRNTPLAGAVLAPGIRGSTTVVPANHDDHDQVCAIIERFEGQASADLARAWLDEQPEPLSVVRSGQDVAGFAYHVCSPTGSGLEDRDPVVRAVLRHVAHHGPARPGEHVGILRFSGSRHHNRDPYAMLAASVSSVTEWLTRPLAWTFVVAVDAEYWSPFFDHLAFTPMLEADHGGLRHVAYGIDWRRLPVDAYLDLLLERGRSGATGPPPASLLRPPPLDHTRFSAALRSALQTLQRPDQLADNPLFGSALAATPTGPTAGQLRTTIEDAIVRLADEPKGDRHRSVLHRTYVRPAPTQEAAAQILDLPLSTYRRHLAKALDHLTDLLWAAEIGEAPRSR